MTRLPMSRAAAALLRGLLARAGQDRDRFLLSDVRSVDWQSLTFAGERHSLALRIHGPDSAAVADRFVDGIENAEFGLGGHIVADLALVARTGPSADGSLTVTIEALTICE